MKRTTLALALIGMCATVVAQTYRWTDPATGRTVISNSPPPAGVQAKTIRQTSPAGDAAGASEAPLAVRQAVRDFPVTLFVGGQCGAPCAGARTLLNSRGIPYAEKLVDTDAAAEELKRVSGNSLLPTLMVGRQALFGLSEGQWHSTLDLAGYPQTAPRGYKPPTPVAPRETPPAPGDANSGADGAAAGAGSAQ